ncbi:ATPase, F0 complex, B chain/subunit B/MI25, partial [Blyttiomyces helicus]
PVARPDPKAVAESLVKSFPGHTMATKSASVLVAASVATYVLSKEIYILDLETFEMGCIFGAWYIWYSQSKDSAVEWLRERRGTVLKLMEQARADHKAVVQERIAHIAKMENLVDVTKDLFDMSKEIAKLEAEAYELKQKAAFTTEVKSVLDAWVRHEASVRDSNQKQLVAHVIDKIRADLANPKIQQDILLQTIADIESKSC